MAVSPAHCAPGLTSVVRMHPNVTGDIARLGQLDHVRPAASIAAFGLTGISPSPQHSLSTPALRRNLVERKIRNKRPFSAYTTLPIGGLLPGTIPSSGGPLDQRRAFCAIVGTTGEHMAKTRISSTDLAWMFQEKLNAFDSCPPAVSIAIVPTGADGWAAVTTARVRAAYPLCARRIEQIQKQLRGIYVLAKD
jgi:hypothetical protein